MANVFKEAKKVQRLHPRMTWQQAIKAAAKKHKKVGAVKKKTKFRQTGTSVISADKARTAKRPGKRKSASGNTYYERRKNRSDVPFALTGFKNQVKEKLAQACLRYELADTISATKKAQADKVKYRKILRSL